MGNLCLIQPHKRMQNRHEDKNVAQNLRNYFFRVYKIQLEKLSSAKPKEIPLWPCLHG